MSNIYTFKSMLEPFVQRLIKKYIDNESGFIISMDLIEEDDARFLISLIKRHCFSIFDIKFYLFWLNSDQVSCFLMPEFNTKNINCIDSFFDLFIKQRRHYSLVYKLLVDLKRLKFIGVL